MIRTYLTAFQIGIVAGMRAMSAPAFVSHKLAHMGGQLPPKSSFHLLASPKTATVLNVLAAGELIGDKRPSAPDRTTPFALTGRVMSGAVSGAALSEIDGQTAGYGAVAGGLGALVGSFAFFHLRHWLTHEQNLPDPLVALAEDAIAIGTGWRLINQQELVDLYGYDS
ncbi:DUF4126 family protein [Spirosoma agri]|uniref:DUF4126 family protein n=1 Tax=Spirosoma agri TaxID=1987381 RepID=A0A6M0INY7_9BACT|nr:DUF4126 family protein [Spirosoma agri]NEU69071.1 DUF4126 family protein [Spirosoma agri]